MGVRDPVGEQAVAVRQGLEQDNSQSAGFRDPPGRMGEQGEVSQREERGRQRQTGRDREMHAGPEGGRERGRIRERQRHARPHAPLHVYKHRDQQVETDRNSNRW